MKKQSLVKYFMLFPILMFVVLFASKAYAECLYRGQTYPVGATIGSYICTKDGWVKQK